MSLNKLDSPTGVLILLSVFLLTLAIVPIIIHRDTSHLLLISHGLFGAFSPHVITIGWAYFYGPIYAHTTVSLHFYTVVTMIALLWRHPPRLYSTSEGEGVTVLGRHIIAAAVISTCLGMAYGILWDWRRQPGQVRVCLYQGNVLECVMMPAKRG